MLLAIIAYARRAGSYVIAEGIETERTLSFVREAEKLHDVLEPQIKGGQGYLLGRPSSDISLLTTPLQSKTSGLVGRLPGGADLSVVGDNRRTLSQGVS